MSVMRVRSLYIYLSFVDSFNFLSLSFSLLSLFYLYPPLFPIVFIVPCRRCDGTKDWSMWMRCEGGSEEVSYREVPTSEKLCEFIPLKVTEVLSGGFVYVCVFLFVWSFAAIFFKNQSRFLQIALSVQNDSWQLIVLYSTFGFQSPDRRAHRIFSEGVEILWIYKLFRLLLGG